MKAAQLALNKAKGAAGEAMAGIARESKKRVMISARLVGGFQMRLLRNSF